MRPRGLTTVLLTVLLGLNATPAAAQPAPGPHVDRQVLAAGGGDVFVMLKEQADLSGGRSLTGHAERAAYGFDRLRDTAERSQGELRAVLRDERVLFTPYWMVNSILVRDASPELIKRLGARSDVARIRKAGSVPLPKPVKAKAVAAAAGVEWGVDRIGASRAWSELGSTGKGIVVATIDTGVQYNHPALATHYRGYRAGGFDHNYNWFDPTGVCGRPSVTPCDNNGHGTHTMGTIVGDDGTNHVGVAPGASWISAKGCESDSCSDAALLAAGQWMIAPTDLTGANPRPDLAPDLVSNSWGASSEDPFYQGIVNAWVNSGIFPVFAAGNAGPDCDTVDSPGGYTNSYAVGAFDSDGRIAQFSSRGAESTGKPNVAAPGVAVRSSYLGGTYEVLSGTSMATPHVAGAIALAWSAAPGLRGDVAATRRLLDETAVDVEDYSCGGTKGDNRVWGQGRLDAFAAVTFAPRGTTGTLSGSVTDLSGAAVAGGTVTLTTTTAHRTVSADASGGFGIALAPGTYQVSATAFGFATATATVTVTAGGATTQNLRLAGVPRFDVYGQVLQTGGEPLPGAVVSIEDTPFPPVTTESDGTFGMYGVPVGTWRVTVRGARCGGSTTVTLTVDGDEFLTVNTPLRKDDFGNKCDVLPTLSWVDGTTVLPLTGDDASAAVTLPFAFPLYGTAYSKAYVSTNGFLNFQRLNAQSINGPIPSGGLPNAALYPFWDDLVVDASASVRTASMGTAPGRRFVVEWRNVTMASQPTARITFSVELREDGQALFQYKSLSSGLLPRGGSATIGLENGAGSLAFDFSVNQPTIRPGMGIRFYGSGVVQGVIRDGTGQPLSGIPVDLVRDGDNTVLLSSVTDASGVYRLFPQEGDYYLAIVTSEYEYAHKDVSITHEGQIVNDDFTLYPQDNTITGRVVNRDGAPVSGMKVGVFDYTVQPVTTGSDGVYRLTGVHGGTQWLIAWSNPCEVRAQQKLVLTGDLTTDLTAGSPPQSAGYQCSTRPKQWIEATDPVDIGATDAKTVNLPFSFPLSGESFTTASVASFGMLLLYNPLTGSWSWVAPFWSNLDVDDRTSIRTATAGTGTGSRFVVEWRDVLIPGTDLRLTFEAVLYPDGRVLLQYDKLPDDPRARADNGDTFIGISNAYGPDMFLVWGPLDPSTALEIHPVPAAT